MASSSRRSRDPLKQPEEDDSSPGAARVLLLCILILVGISMTMLFSIGIGQSRPLHYPVRQFIYAVVAILGGVVSYNIPTIYWKKWMIYLVGSSVILLGMARLVGREINNAHRWLSLGPVNFQPSELAKLSAILWVATWMSVYRRRSSEFGLGFVLPASGMGLLCLMVLMGPDFGTTMLIGGTGILLMYIGGTRVVYLGVSAFVALFGFWELIRRDPERLSRITSFMHPEEFAANDSYQLMASLHGFIEGGLFGKGIGESLQKNDYLPEAHTDFILAILGEELGLVGTLLVLLLFVAIFISGLMISLRCKDAFSRLVGLGITITITLQAMINVGVVTGSMPTKGLPLPFVSYGGSSLVFMTGMVGILLRISRGSAGVRDNPPPLPESQQWI
ncbi:putative lipid II flippase FtsW [Kiritimatiellota bacterium B12222]|nr:putative lipid II flippase FtsW [Kiritimatiellota bacterium B12222]